MKIKSLLATATLVLGALSTQAFAASTTLSFNASAGPMQYQGMSLFGCTWTYSSSTGSNAFVTFFYKPVGSCPYTLLNVTASYSMGAPSSATATTN
jgi:hypothetical protein